METDQGVQMGAGHGLKRLCDNEELARAQAEFCSVLSSATRVRVLCALSGGERAVSELAERLDIPVVNLSQHLRVLRDKGAVTTRRDGKRVLYAVATPRFIEGLWMIRQGLVEVLKARGGVFADDLEASTEEANPP